MSRMMRMTDEQYSSFVQKRPRKCALCPRTFVSDRPHKLYCGPACSRAANKAKLGGKRFRPNGLGSGGAIRGAELVPRRTCEVCGGRFQAPPTLVKRGGGRFCSITCRARHVAMHPELYPHTQSRRGLGGIREDLDGRYFRSAWEANYARYLNWLAARGAIARWEYEPHTFEFTDIRRGSRFYTPDFKVYGLNGTYIWHEIKGYMDARSATKIRRFRARYPDEQLLVIDKAAYYPIAQQMKPMIPAWEGRIRLS